MLRLVSDIEANGFLDEVTKIHCIVAKDIDQGHKYFFYDEPISPAHLYHGNIDVGIDFIFTADILIGHNFIGYDLPVIKKLRGKVYHGQVFDTVVLSRVLNPERRLPRGCPTSVPNPVTKRKDRIHPHSLAAWGYRVGRGKVDHYDWMVFSADMLHRCDEDVEINHLTLDALMRELNLPVDTPYSELPGYVRYEQRVAVIMQRQMETGWLVDMPLLHTHVNTLKTMRAELEVTLEPRLPWIAKPKESKFGPKDKKAAYINKSLGTDLDDEQAKLWGERKFVSKPFMASGKWNASVTKLFPEYDKFQDDPEWAVETATGDMKRWSIGGPFCRVEFRKISLTSDAEVKDYLLTQGWQPDEWNFSKITKLVTSPKFTESSLDTIKGDTGILIAKHMKVCQRLSTMEGWVTHIGEDNRLYGIVNPQACPTVRMTHKILVNVPSVEKKSFFAEEMREIFIAPKGYTLVSADAVSCQARMLCQYMGDDTFTEAVVNGNKADGTDIHSYNMRKAGLKTRGHAKNFFYGFIFGMQATAVGRLVGRGKQRGQEIINQYLSSIPKLKTLRKGLEETWRSRGYLLGLDGRKIYINRKMDLLCYMLQSAEAMVMKIAICLVNHWIEQEGLNAKMVCVYHDEYTFEVRDDSTERVAFLAEEAIREAGRILGLTVPSDGEAMIGANWKEIH